MNIRLDLISMHIEGITKHPLTFIHDLGIIYKRMEAVPMGDCWLFYDVSGSIPEEFKQVMTSF